MTHSTPLNRKFEMAQRQISAGEIVQQYQAASIAKLAYAIVLMQRAVETALHAMKMLKAPPKTYSWLKSGKKQLTLLQIRLNEKWNLA